MAALFQPEPPWYFDHRLHHYGRFADCTAPVGPTASENPSKTADGQGGRSSSASRCTRRSSPARNCFLVSLNKPTWRHRRSRVHVALLSEAWTPDLGSTPNSHVSPYDAAFPGTLPVSNIEKSVWRKLNIASVTMLASQSCMRGARSQSCHCTSIRNSTAINV
jgi:hypothetical protein